MKWNEATYLNHFCGGVSRDQGRQGYCWWSHENVIKSGAPRAWPPMTGRRKPWKRKPRAFARWCLDHTFRNGIKTFCRNSTRAAVSPWIFGFLSVTFLNTGSCLKITFTNGFAATQSPRGHLSRSHHPSPVGTYRGFGIWAHMRICEKQRM